MRKKWLSKSVGSRRSWFFLFLIFLLGPLVHLVFWRNFHVEKKEKTSSRLLASLEEGEGKNSKRETSRLRWFGEFLKSNRIRLFRHLGRYPSKREELQFGFLRGRYKLKFYQEKLERVEFINFSEEKLRRSHPPLSHFDTRKFIKDYSHFFPSGFDVKQAFVQKTKRIKEDQEHFYETYLFSDIKKRKYKAEFEWSSEKKFLSLRIAEADLF